MATNYIHIRICIYSTWSLQGSIQKLSFLGRLIQWTLGEIKVDLHDSPNDIHSAGGC